MQIYQTGDPHSVENRKKAEEKLTPRPRILLTNRYGRSYGFYGVGMFVKHQKMKYSAVIVGWDVDFKQQSVTEK